MFGSCNSWCLLVRENIGSWFVLCSPKVKGIIRFDFRAERLWPSVCGKVLRVTEHTADQDRCYTHCLLISHVRRPSHRRGLGSRPRFLLTHRTLSEKMDIWWAGLAVCVLMVMILRILSAPCCWWYGSTNLFLELMFSFLIKRKL